jgi:hypothetical protein
MRVVCGTELVIMHAGMKRSNEGKSLRYKFRAFTERKRSSAESPAQQASNIGKP